MSKEFILEQLHRLYREDPWVNELLRAGTVTMEQLAEKILEIYNSNWFDTMSESYVDLYEKKLGIAKNPSKSLADRRGAIEAKWKSSGKITVDMLQALMDTMGPGCTVKFEEGVINVIGEGYVPDENRMNVIDEIKPAHIPAQQIGRLSMMRYEALTGGVLVEITGDDIQRSDCARYVALTGGVMVEITGTTEEGDINV